MRRKEIEAIFARRQQAWDDRDAAGLASDYTDDAVVESPLAGGTTTGREAIEKLYVTYFSAFHDFKFEPDVLLIEGDHVAQFGRVTGTDSGGFMGMPPTRRKVSFRVALCFTVQDGRIVRERRIYDFTGLLIQVGLLKAKPV